MAAKIYNDLPLEIRNELYQLVMEGPFKFHVFH